MVPRQVGADLSTSKKNPGFNSKSPQRGAYVRSSNNNNDGVSGKKIQAGEAIRGNVDIQKNIIDIKKYYQKNVLDKAYSPKK